MGLILPGKRSAVRRSLTRHCLSNVPQESWLGLELVLVEIRVAGLARSERKGSGHAVRASGTAQSIR